MQCLANSYGMKIVEPFIEGSLFAFPFNRIARGRNPLRLRDLIDVDLWNEQTSRVYNYLPLASWEEFLSKAPRSVVLLCIKYRDPPRIPIPIPGHDYKLGCTHEDCFKKFDDTVSFLSRFKFRVVRKACANFLNTAASVTDKQLLKSTLEKLKQDNVTIITNQFRGFFGLYRLPVASTCGVTHAVMNVLTEPSTKLVEDANKYVKEHFENRKFVSILVRIERIVLHNFLNVTKCGELVLSKLKKLKKERNLKDYFLAMDIGKFGSKGSNVNKLEPQGKGFFRQVYGSNWRFKDWEESFQVSNNSNPAYIANLQRTISARGSCLLMVGGGGFQYQARKLYSEYHPDPNSSCIYQICGW